MKKGERIPGTEDNLSPGDLKGEILSKLGKADNPFCIEIVQKEHQREKTNFMKLSVKEHSS